MDLQITGKRALVTGATRGIGRAIAEALVAAGAEVLINAEEREECERTVAELGGDTVSLPADLTSADDVASLADRCGRVDLLFGNAGAPPRLQPGHDGYEEEVGRVFALNLHASRRLCERLLPAMAAGSGGAVVLTASLAGLRGNASASAYSLTKAALIQLARDLAVRWGPCGVRANAICPGLVETGWEKAVLHSPDVSERRMRMTPLRRIGQPAEVAAVAVFLASPLAGFVTGQSIAVDGGTSITDGG